MWLILLGLFVVLFYIYLIKPLNYWKNQGIKHVKPVPFFGNVMQAVLMRVNVIDVLQKPYDSFKKERFFGFFPFTDPVLVITDVEIIKNIGIKDFDHFVDRQMLVADDVDPLWNKILNSKRGAKWRHLRYTLSPSFTGSKMKMMFSLISDCSEQFVDYFLKQNEDIVSVEMKYIFTRFTNDVIATCAFGVKCDSLKNPNNEFYCKGRDAADFSGLKAFKFLAYLVSPALAKLFQVKIISESTGNFFRKIIGDTIKYREDKQIFRPDMIQLLMEARKTSIGLSDEDITAQAMIFFLAGFDTSSSLMMYIAYELAVNKNVQNKLIQEINSTWLACNEKLTYEALIKMKYLDMIVSETLRKWPPTPITNRVCTKDYKIPSTNFTIQKDSVVWFPIYQIHRDEDHYPQPDKFIPERFDEENKRKMHQSAYLPFGIGPRICIASRFALMENKIIFFHLLRHFEIVPVEKSVIPVLLSTRHFNMEAKGGMWLGFKRRTMFNQFK